MALNSSHRSATWRGSRSSSSSVRRYSEFLLHNAHIRAAPVRFKTSEPDSGALEEALAAPKPKVRDPWQGFRQPLKLSASGLAAAYRCLLQNVNDCSDSKAKVRAHRPPASDLQPASQSPLHLPPLDHCVCWLAVICRAQRPRTTWSSSVYTSRQSSARL